MTATQGLDPDTVDVSATQQQPRATQNAGIVNALGGSLGELFGGGVEVATATTRATANVINSGAGPALLLLIGGVALATYVRRKR